MGVLEKSDFGLKSSGEIGKKTIYFIVWMEKIEENCWENSDWRGKKYFLIETNSSHFEMENWSEVEKNFVFGQKKISWCHDVYF